MRHSKKTLAIVALLAATLSAAAFARGPGRHGHHFRHHGGARIGVVVAAPLLAAPFLYLPPRHYYYAPPPPVYIEQPPPRAYWYFCPSLNAYYPQVQTCPDAWQPVLPPG